MKLEEAMDMLKETVKRYKEGAGKHHSEGYDYGRQALETVINYIENESIPKEKVEKKIEQLTENDNLVINEKWDSVDVVCAKREEMAQVDILQELLGE